MVRPLKWREDAAEELTDFFTLDSRIEVVRGWMQWRKLIWMH